MARYCGGLHSLRIYIDAVPAAFSGETATMQLDMADQVPALHNYSRCCILHDFLSKFKSKATAAAGAVEIAGISARMLSYKPIRKSQVLMT